MKAKWFILFLLVGILATTMICYGILVIDAVYAQEEEEEEEEIQARPDPLEIYTRGKTMSSKAKQAQTTNVADAAENVDAQAMTSQSVGGSSTSAASAGGDLDPIVPNENADEAEAGWDPSEFNF